MRVLIGAVGRARDDAHAEVYTTYAKRIRWPLSLREVEVKERLSGDRLKTAEGEKLLSLLPSGAKLVVLDQRGRSMDTRSFSTRLGQWRDEGVADVAFLIGGADGHGEPVRTRADLLLSLGAMTWPHMMVRGMLAEQIYRAQQILAGHPYHRD